MLRCVVEYLAGLRLGGFTTEEIRESGARRGFRLVDLRGGTRVIAHVDFPKRHAIGRYGVDVGAIDTAASRLRVDPQPALYLVDEIGRMECLSTRFVAAIRGLLSGSTPVVATVGQRGGGFLAEVRTMPEATLWEVTRENRDALPERVLSWLRQRGGVDVTGGAS